MAAPRSARQPRPQATPDPDTNPAGRLDDEAPRVIRLRLAPWDVICTFALLAVLVVLVTMTTWPTRLFGFTDNVCADECAPVPFGVNYYIYPVMWGGIGAAIAAAVLGPFVSLLKGWYMSFWPVVAVAVLMVTSVAGPADRLQQRYWL